MIVILVSLELLFRGIPNEYTFKKDYLDLHSNEIETLILGNSHNYYGLNPAYFNDYNTFNAAFTVQRTYFDLEILKKYEKNFEHLTTVILPIVPMELFFKPIQETSVVFNPSIHKYRIYYDLEIPFVYGDYFEISSKIFRLRSMSRTIISYYFEDKDQVKCSELGWGTNYNWQNSNDLEGTGRITAKQHDFIAYGLNEQSKGIEYNTGILESIIEWCNERNINLLLYTPPVYESYRRGVDSSREEIAFDILHDLALKYDNCTYESFYDDTNFMEKDFFDADHLSDLGAEKLSKMMDERVHNLN
tara:strand:- start:3018 stop:3926 length:909 start_codon:yes stop_codon:yes gene_type:complete